MSLCLSAQKKAPQKITRILFVFDASRSMVAKHENMTRMEGAKTLLFRFIDSLSKKPNYQFALRMYGHKTKYPPGNCKESELLVPFSPNNLTAIRQKVSEAKPTGITPIEHSLTEAANDFKDRTSINIVIIITDGIEECGGDPCKARQKLLEKGIVFKPFIIGIGLTPKQIKTFECVGTFFDYDNDSTFSTISKIIQQQKLNKSTAQVNLLNQESLPLETNVNMSFYDLNTGAYKYNYVHTMNSMNRPDTLVLDEAPLYKVVAHTIPPVESRETKLNSGKHTVIPIDAPQGYLSIQRNEGPYNFNQKVKCVLRKTGEMQTLNVQELNRTEKYITGTYDLEILTLPRILISGKKIEQSKTTSIEIPNAGILSIKCLEAGDGCIMLERGGKLDWVCNLGTQTQQDFYLQPGNYVAVWRARSLRGSIYSIEKKFSIRSDNQTMVEFFR
ncbi:MAG TPA: VWA domain-containing protein [Bacteroidia bacterium]|nr:VWA domain-containing protein [Bacteroidia bacterium]